MKNRNVALVVLFSILTCGIYSIYWLYVTAEDLNMEDPDDPLMNYILALLLGIITCGIFTIYWEYKFFKKVDAVTGEDNTLINLLLSILLTPIVGMAISQNSLNRIATEE